MADAQLAATTDAKGELYEELVKYPFEAGPGCLGESNTTNVLRPEQIDVAVGNGRLPDGQWLLPHVIIVGSKRWDEPVDSSRVGYFMNIRVGRGVELSILVAANGITGNRDDLTDAHALGLHGSPRGAHLSNEGPYLLSIKDAAKALGISNSTLYQLTAQGDIEWVMIGSRKYISRESLLDFIKANTHKGYYVAR